VTSLQTSIIKTLIYADIFDFPLKAGELHRFLISSKETQHSQVKTSLNQFVKTNRVGNRGDYYFLKSRPKLARLRPFREIISREKQKKSRGVGNWLRLFPTIKSVYITGALALNNAKKSDDIDLMIITKTNWLWTTRLIVNLLFDCFKIRRKPKSRLVANKFCLNLWLDDTHLSLPRKNRNLYTAHEIAQAIPLWDRDNTHQQFLYQNHWISKFLPNFPLPSKPHPTKTKQPQTLSSQHVNIIERLVYKIQRYYMKSRLTREQVSHHSAFFHPRNTAKFILDKYHSKLKTYKIT